MAKRGLKPGTVLGPRKPDTELRRLWRMSMRLYRAEKRKKEDE